MEAIDRGVSLLHNGYQIVPVIRTKQTSVPLVKNFLKPETVYGEDDALKWARKYRGADVALVGGKNNVYALDFDIDNRLLADKLRRAMIKKYPGIPVRRCNDPRFAVLFRATDELLELKNAHSKGYKKTNDSDLNWIELIGGKLLTLYGKHRKTGNTYTWGKEFNPCTLQVAQLPELDIDDIKKIFATYEGQVSDSNKLIHESSFSKRHQTEETFETAKAVRQFSDTEIDALLSESTGNDRKSWLRVGMALHAHYGSTVKGLKKWNKWSKQFEGYETTGCRTAWKHFTTEGGLTLGSIEYDVKKKKKKNQKEEFQEFVKDHVLIERGSRVGKLSAMPAESILTLGEFNLKHANVSVSINTKSPNGKDAEKKIPITSLWKTNENRRTCFDTQYIPVSKRLVKNVVQNTKRTYWNTYVPAELTMTNSTDLLHYFTDHIEYLFNDEGDAAWYYNWLAQLIQDPVNRYRMTPLHISTFQGTGRGWLTLLMTELVGVQNVSKTNIKHLVKEDGFTGYLNQSVLCFLDEVYEASKERYRVNDRMKTLLSDSYQDVNLKYGLQMMQMIYTRFMLMSNHVDCIVIDQLDQRLEVFINRSVPKQKSHYSKLYELLKSQDFLNQCYSFLMRYEVNTDLLVKPRKTKARDTLIKATKSQTANAFFEFKNIVGDYLYHDNMIHKFIGGYHALHHPTDASSFVNPKEVNALERTYMQISGLKMVNFKGGKKTLNVKSFSMKNLDDLSVNETTEQLKRAQRKINLYIKQWSDQDE